MTSFLTVLIPSYVLRLTQHENAVVHVNYFRHGTQFRVCPSDSNPHLAWTRVSKYTHKYAQTRT